MQTYEKFDAGELDAREHSVYRQLQDADVPDDYVLQWIDGRGFQFSREDALPVPENESNGAAVVAERTNDPGTDSWTVTLYHEDGTPHMGMLKGFGASCESPTLTDAIEAATRAMRLDDQLATAETN
jgi:hypothetical protein